MHFKPPPINLPRLPILSFESQGRDPWSSLPDVRSAGSPVYTTSGRAAIALALESLGVNSADKVLVPTYHCPTMVAPIVRLGATPVFFPITAAGLPNMSWLKQQSGSAKVLIVPHYFGIPRDLSAVRAFCDARGTALLEDCAHSFFGLAGDRPIGTWGDLTTASLTKFFPGPDGGLLIARSAGRSVAVRPQTFLAELRAWIDTIEMGARYQRLGALNFVAAAVFRLKAMARGALSERADGQSVTDPEVIMDCLDERQIPMQASAAVRWVVRTTSIERVIRGRQSNYRRLVEMLSGANGICPAFADLPSGAVPYVCPVVVRQADAVYAKLRRAGIPVFRWDVLWPGTPRLEGDTGREWSHSLLQVACHQDLSDDDMQLIARHIALTVEEFLTESVVRNQAAAATDLGERA